MLLWLSLACDPTDSDSGKPDPDTFDVTLTAAPAFDPTSAHPLTWSLSGADADPATQGEIVDAAGEVVRSAVLVAEGWDGLLDDGSRAATGPYTLRVGTGGRRREASVELVRVGLTSAWAEDDGGITASRVPLYWSGKRHIQDVSAAFASTESIDDVSGVATPLPAVGTELELPAESAAEPLAYTYDSRPIVSVSFGSDSHWGAPNVDAATLTVSADGWTVLSDATVAAGGTVTLQKDERLGDTLGVSEAPLVLHVTATDDAGTAWPVQDLEVPLTVYRLLDNPTWDAEGERYNPWVSAVDPALRAIEGTAPERDAVLDALVRWVFEDEGLEYDTVSGASAYTVYAGGDWTRANFNMGAYLARKYGVVVNCTDCAGIIVGFGNMLGAHVEYAIIGWNFELNYILAIGGAEFDHCPFGDWGCGFSYHAVSMSPEGDLIWDATLALDGDDDPGSAPHTELLVQSIDADEYLDRLAMTPADYAYQAQGGLQ